MVRRIPSSGRPSSRRGPPRPLPLLRRGLGCGSRRPPSVRLVVSPVFDLFYQPSRASCSSLCGSGLSPFSSRSCSRSVFGQLHCFSLLQESRGHLVVHLECSRSGASPALRGSFHPAPSPVHSRPSECSGGFVQPSLSSPGVRVNLVSADGSRSSSPLACQHRPLLDVAQSWASGVLHADVRSAVSWHGCHASVVGRPSGLCLSTFQPPSACSGEGSALSGVGADSGGSVLASAPLVPRPSGASAGDSLLPATKEGSSQTAPFPPLPPEPICASADCVSYLQRSSRHAGFSAAVTRQLANCRRRSTLVNYQAKWLVYRAWCHRHGHSVSRPKVADFLLYLHRSLSLSLLLFYCFLPLHAEQCFSLCSS